MQIRGRVLETPDSALKVAGDTIRGYRSAEEVRDERKRKQLADERAAEAQRLQSRQLDATMKRLDMATQRHIDTMAEKEAKAKREESQRAAASAGDQAVLGAVQGPQMQGPTPGGAPLSGNPQLPPFLNEAFAKIDEGLKSGALSHDDAADQIKAVGTVAATAIKKAQQSELDDRLHNEGSYWNGMQALGVEIDIDGDGKSDPVAAVPEFLHGLLKDGHDPEDVAAIHEQLKQAFDRERAQIEYRTGIGQQARTELGAIGGQMPPEAYQASGAVISAWERGEYEQNAQGKAEFDRDRQAASAGLVPIVDKATGARMYAPIDEARRHALGQGRGAQPKVQVDPAQAALREGWKQVQAIYPPFIAPKGQMSEDGKHFLAATEEEIAKAEETYTKRMKAWGQKEGLLPPDAAPQSALTVPQGVPTGPPPGAGGVPGPQDAPPADSAQQDPTGSNVQSAPAAPAFKPLATPENTERFVDQIAASGGDPAKVDAMLKRWGVTLEQLNALSDEELAKLGIKRPGAKAPAVKPTVRDEQPGHMQ